MAEIEGAGQELSSEEPGMIKIGSRIWKVGDKVHSKGAEAVEEAKMVDAFGAAWKTALVEGEILGKGGLRKVRVQWNSFSTPHIQEYGYQHSMFNTSSEDGAQKTSKKRSNSEISSEAPRVTGRSAFDEICGEILYSSEGELSEDEDIEEENGEQISAISGLNSWVADVTLDAFDCSSGRPKHLAPAQVKFPRRIDSISEANCVDYFELFLPSSILSQLVAWTNATIHKESEQICLSDIRKYVASILAMTLQPESNIKRYWSTEDTQFTRARDFTRCIGLSCDSFSDIREVLQIGPFQEQSRSFIGFREFQDLLNSNMKQVFTAGARVVLGQTTSGWQGIDDRRAGDPPALTHMKADPEPVSFVIKNVADVETGIIFHLELQEGRESMHSKQFSHDHKPTTAVVRRLLQSIVSSGRIVYMDSWFTNMDTVRVVEETGNYMVGVVKQGKRDIPQDHLVSHQYRVRGEHKVLHRTDEHGRRIICVGWNEPGKKAGSKKPGVKVFVASAHSGASVQPWAKERTILRSDGSIHKRTHLIPRPDVVEAYYLAANTMDDHNQYRQGLVALERIWATKSWKTRLFQTYVGIMLVNAFLAFKFDQSGDLTLQDFTERVVAGLVAAAHEPPPGEGVGGGKASVRVPGGARSRRLPAAAAGDPEEAMPKHSLVSNKARGVGGGAKLVGRCRVCNTPAYAHCCTCSAYGERSRGAIFYLCVPGASGRHCYTKHVCAMLTDRQADGRK